MKSNIYLGETFKIGTNSTVRVELNLSALGIQNSTITGISGGFVTGIKEVGTSTNVKFPFTIGDSSVVKKLDVILSESLNSSWTLKDFPIYITISTKEFGRFSHLVQVNLGVEPPVVILSGELEQIESISLGNLSLEVSNASQYQSFSIKNIGQLSLTINEINFLEFDSSNPDYVTFTDSYQSALSLPFSISAGQEKQIFVKFNTQTSHTNDNYTRVLKLPIEAQGLQIVKNLMVLHRELTETDYGEINLIDEYCKIQIISNDIRNPIHEFPIIQTQFVAPFLFVDKDIIDITKVLEGSDNYREIMIRNPSPTEDLIISEISTDYYTTTNNGNPTSEVEPDIVKNPSPGTPVDYMSISHKGDVIDFSLTNITIPPNAIEVFTLRFVDARFPEYEINGSYDFPYFKRFDRNITIKSNAVNSFFTGSDTYAQVKSNNSGETYIPFAISIVKKTIDINPIPFINPDFDIVLGGGSTPNQAIPTQGLVSLEAIAEAFGSTNTDPDWDDVDHLDLVVDGKIDIFDMVQFVNNMNTYESTLSSMHKQNSEAIYSYTLNENLGNEKYFGSDSEPFSIINLTTSNFTDSPLGESETGDSIEYKLTISTNDYEISPRFHRNLPTGLTGDFKDLTYIDDVPRALGKSSSDSDWSTYNHLDFDGNSNIDIFDLVSIGNAVTTADNALVPTVAKIDEHMYKREGDDDWDSISYLDLNGDGYIYLDDRALASELSQTKETNWTTDTSLHTWDSTTKTQIIKDWDDGNRWIYRAYWDSRGEVDLASNPGIHFKSIPLTRDSLSDSSLDLTITLYARRKNDVHKKEYSVSKTIKMFAGESNIPKPVVKYKMSARKNAKFEYEGRAYSSILETSNSLTNPTWEVFDVINHSQYAKNTGISEGMKGLWIEEDYDKFDDPNPHYGTFTYAWNFSVKDGVDDQDDYGFTRSDGKIAWKTALPTNASDSYNVVDASTFNAQRTSWEPKGLVYKTSGVKTITSSITNTDYNITSETHSRKIKIFKDFNEKMEITPVEVSLLPKTLSNGKTSVAYITVKNTSTTDYKSIIVESIREFPNRIRFGDTLESKLVFDLTPKDYPGGGNSKEVAIYVEVLSKYPKFKKDYSEGQVKISSGGDEDYSIVELYGDAVSPTRDLGEYDIDFLLDSNIRSRLAGQNHALTGFGTSSETASPHAFLIGFLISDNQNKDDASNAHNLRNLDIDFKIQDQETHPIIKTHVLGTFQSEFSFQDSQSTTKTPNGFKVLTVDSKAPVIDLSLSDSKTNKLSLSYQLSHDIIMELSDNQTYRQKNKPVKVNSVDPTIELILSDSETRTLIHSHAIKANSVDPLIEMKLEDSRTTTKTVGYWKNITENGVMPVIDFQIKDDKYSRLTLTHELKLGGSSTLEANLQFSDDKLFTINYGAYKEIKVNNLDPVINLYWRDIHTKTIT